MGFGWLFGWVYSSLLLAVLVLGSPYWLVRMATSGRYRAGLWGRLGFVPRSLVQWRGTVDRVAWVHAVSVGEVLVAARLIEEFRRVRPDLRFAVSTTTKTGQELARARLGDGSKFGCGVFYLPLDFGFAVRRYLRAIRPEMLVLMESELWPNLLAECGRAGVPVAVANARVSDRSFPRYMQLRRLWRPLMERVAMFLAQSEETGERLGAIGAAKVRVTGNVKYDARVSGENRLAALIQEAAAGRPIVIAGSTVEETSLDEDRLLIQAWEGEIRRNHEALLVLAPRHPERFAEVHSVAVEFPTLLASEMLAGMRSYDAFSGFVSERVPSQVEIVVLDTIGDLAAVYGVADVAFVGGSLVRRGGHNPLEPARFGVPVVMGPSYENFREIVERMRAADGIRIVADKDELANALGDLLTDRAAAKALGERGRRVFEEQQGATVRTVAALLEILQGGAR